MTDLTWTAPGPGQWTAAIDHFARPMTPIAQDLFATTFSSGFRKAFDELGAPLDTLDMRFVNGVSYVRPKPVVDKPGSAPPPWPILRLACLAHPTLRRRNKTAKETMTGGWRRNADRWWNVQRDQYLAANRAIQAVDLAALDDDALLAHLDEATDHLHDGLHLHFEISPLEVMPFGLLCVAAEPWGITPEELLDVLVGASPATTEPMRALEPLRRELAAHDCRPDTIDDIRSCSDEARRLLDDWLADRSWIVTSGYDLDCLTLGELPQVIVAAVLADAPPDTHPDPAAPFQDRVPPNEWQRFTELVADARAAFALRDDNGPLTGEWPTGLVRRALLEVGGRLVDRGLLDDPEPATSATREELTRALAGDPDAARSMTERQAARRSLDVSEIPSVLGEAESTPDLRGLPHALRLGTQASLVILDLELAADRRRDATATATTGAVVGYGIGEGLVRGRARVATDPDDLETLEPGDVIVTAATSPTWNMVLAAASGLVVEEGGLTGHAAIVSRELGLPALIGAKGATRLIPDGAEVELDTVTGEARVLSGG